MKKRFLRCGLVVMLAASMLMTGCGGSGSSEGSSEGSKTAAQEENLVTGVTIDEQVLVDEKDVTVTATGLGSAVSNGSTTYYLEIKVENGTDKNIGVYFDNSSVNGYFLYANTVPVSEEKTFIPGESEGRIYFTRDSLKFAPFDKIGEIFLGKGRVSEQELQTLETSEGETMEYYSEKADQIVEPLYSIKDTVIKTSAYDESQICMVPEGEVLYESDGVSLIVAPTEDENILGDVFYLKNETEENIYTSVYNLVINDVEFSDTEYVLQTPSIDARPGQVAVGYFGNDDLTMEILSEKGITSIETLKCNIVIIQNLWDEEILMANGEPIVEGLEYSYTAE